VIVSPDLDALAVALGPRARRDEPLAHHTAMRVGGPADVLIVCESVGEVVRSVGVARRHDVPWRLLGGGCNVLVADNGIRGLVIVNRAARIEFAPQAPHAVGGAVTANLKSMMVRAEAGALLSVLAHETVERGLAGLEWASGLPGTVGGAVVGNAGAFEGDIASVLRSATVLEPGGEVLERPAEWFEFEYRGSRIKRRERRPPSFPPVGGDEGGGYVVLAAIFDLRPGEPEALAARADEILEWRRTRHPSGATMGSTFKNPPGSHAGYLIEQTGLRGYCIGGAQISELHGNFFMNTGGATAADVLALIQHARAEVKRQFGVELELEIELVGW
jgi:UDP-N-acetylmuramate dehydrogenase